MDNSGWIKLHRGLLKWEWYDDIPTKVLFLHLLLSANHEDGCWHGNIVKRGQFITGRIALSKQTGLTQRQIRTALTKLKSTNEVAIKTTSQFSVITICNYEKFQEQPTNETTSGVANERPASDHQQEGKEVIIKKEINKEKAEAESHPSFVRLSELCATIGLVNSVNPELYLQTLFEYMNKINTVQEMRDCLYWCKDHNVKSVNIQRLRNWFKKAKEFQKSDELRKMAAFKDKAQTQDSVKMPTYA